MIFIIKSFQVFPNYFMSSYSKKDEYDSGYKSNKKQILLSYISIIDKVKILQNM